MKLYTIETGYFKLDGGAMFGVVPKSLWEKQNPADQNNMCNWAMRCLLIVDGDKKILIDNGLGNKQDEKFFSYYYLNGDDTLVKSLAKHGFAPEDITDNILTHLHFDHCGGGVKWNADQSGYAMTFPNAKYHVSAEHWEEALHPNAREKASFLKENILPMQASGQLNLIAKDTSPFTNIELGWVYGHTRAMMLPKIYMPGKNLIYMADLIPAAFHIPIPWVMGYDMHPLTTMQEKEKYLSAAVEENTILFYEHDPVTECSTVEKTERGYKVKERFALDTLIA